MPRRCARSLRRQSPVSARATIAISTIRCARRGSSAPSSIPIRACCSSPAWALSAPARRARTPPTAANTPEPPPPIRAAAEAIGRYEPLDESDLFDVEYWSLEQAKLGKEPEKPLARQVALVTGAAGAIGLAACVELAKAGAHVVLTDIDPEALERARGKVAQ